MNKFSKELIESMTEACEHAEGKPGRGRVHTVGVPCCARTRGQAALPPAAASSARHTRSKGDRSS